MSNKSIVFLHIPKVAGTSMSRYCTANGIIINYHLTRSDRYLSLDDYKKNYCADCFVFTFVRNPWDRLVSAYHFLAQGVGNKDDKLDWEKYLSAYGNFQEFVEEGLASNSELVKNQIHLRTQKSWMIDGDGKIIVDFIGKFEDLQKDFNKLTKLIGTPHYELPHSNKSVHRDYRSYYSRKTEKIVASIYKDDIEAFGYTFDK